MPGKDPEIQQHAKPRLAYRKTVVVIGAGIGAEISRRLASEGAAAVLADRNAERFASVAQQCKELGDSDWSAVTVDVSDPASCTAWSTLRPFSRPSP